MDYSGTSLLERLWRARGTQYLKQYFTRTARRDPDAACRLLNDEPVGFPVLFIVTDDIYAYGLFWQMNDRLKTAMRLTALKTTPKEWVSAPPLPDDETTRETLRWMLATGKRWDGPSRAHDAYDAVLDYAAALLTDIYDDKTALADIVELIFRRNRKGLFINDLVWAFFQTLDTNALALVAARLRSPDVRDTALAARLLHLELPEGRARGEAARLYKDYTSWLQENQPYLYLTGEHFQMTSRPGHLDVDREARYLGKAISPRARTPVEPLTPGETDCLTAFRQLSDDERELLSAYSGKLRSENHEFWDDWIGSGLAEQVMAAGKGMGIAHDFYR